MTYFEIRLFRTKLKMAKLKVTQKANINLKNYTNLDNKNFKNSHQVQQQRNQRVSMHIYIIFSTQFLDIVKFQYFQVFFSVSKVFFPRSVPVIFNEIRYFSSKICHTRV